MRGTRVARRYARALLELAERSQAEQWGEELTKLAATVESPELRDRLVSPELSLQAREQAMAKTAERLELSFPLRSLAVVVARHGRISEMAAISDAYGELVDERLGRARASLTFAVAPSQAEIERVVAGLASISRKQIIATVNVDASLIGGVVAELEGKIYDGSLAQRIVQAQRRLAG
ncbi:MAG: ATP synthase F1 subunit delta [Candidatus Binataceae bacterium]